MLSDTRLPSEPKLLDLLRKDPEEFAYLAGEPLRAPFVAATRLSLKIRGQKPVGYIGWIGHRNLGDEAMFDVIRMALPELQVIQFGSPVAERSLAKIGLSGRSFFRAVLLGGGTLIHPLYLEAARLVKSFGTPLYTAGTGVGSPGFGSSEGFSLDGWGETFDRQFVGVRGPLSQGLLQNAGLTQASVIGDPALGLTPETIPAFGSRNHLVISLAQEPGAPHVEKYPVIEHLGRLAKAFTADGGEVVGVALGNGDRAVLTRFKNENGLAKMSIEDHRTSGEGLLQTLTGSVALIGVRLHAAVLASCVGVPPLLFAYRRKCEDFMAAMELSDFTIPLSPETPADLLSAKWNQVRSQPDLGGRIYRKALFWKAKQHLYYRRLAEHILST